MNMSHVGNDHFRCPEDKDGKLRNTHNSRSSTAPVFTTNRQCERECRQGYHADVTSNFLVT